MASQMIVLAGSLAVDDFNVNDPLAATLRRELVAQAQSSRYCVGKEAIGGTNVVVMKLALF